MSKSQKELDLDRENLENAYKQILGTKHGRMVFSDILQKTGVDGDSAVQGHFKTNETFFNNGKSSVGRWLRNKLQATNMDDFTKILKDQ